MTSSLVVNVRRSANLKLTLWHLLFDIVKSANSQTGRRNKAKRSWYWLLGTLGQRQYKEDFGMGMGGGKLGAKYLSECVNA